MARFRLRHAGLKILSIAVATLLWLVVTGDAVVERTLRVGIELQRAPADLELVGCFAHSAQKSGKDVAELVGLDAPTGGRATSDVAELLAL